MAELIELGLGYTDTHGIVPHETSHIEGYLKANGIYRCTKNCSPRKE